MEISEIIVAAGPLSDSIQHISSNEDGTLLIRTKDNSFSIHRMGHRIVFEAVIDTPIDTQREQVFAALLTYSAVWQDTGFVRMALTTTGAEAQAILIADVILDETFTDQYLANVVEDLDAKIQIWRDIIAAGADDGSNLSSQEHTIRV